MSKSKIFRSNRLEKAYHQIPNEESTIEITTFICEFGQFEYLSMPRGISTAPATFQRYMNAVLSDFIAKNSVNPYQDDIFIFIAELSEQN